MSSDEADHVETRIEQRHAAARRDERAPFHVTP